MAVKIVLATRAVIEKMSIIFFMLKTNMVPRFI